MKRNKDSAENWSHKNDFLIEDVWGTCHVLAQLIVPRLLAFKELDKHGRPADFENMREWNNAIQKMADAFELLKYASSYSDKEERTINLGMDLFCKYFRYLRD